ncbi:MAG TPA: HAD family hydrolase [Burkholderiales bacterium]|nr:HAD family hydrolase [Burkholderiales bacterium]
MVIIFDLDDTLYDERTYVESGFRAVASFGAARFGWNKAASIRFMLDTLEHEGRGAVFDRWLENSGRYSNSLVQECIRVYRNHQPRLHLYREARTLLPTLSRYPLYIVTDGHKVVQQKKVEGLRIERRFRHIFITHRYGVRHEKPSTYCFERIRLRERCEWEDMIYIGDNPAKDFVNLNSLGVATVRVLTGGYRAVKAAKSADARFTIPHLGHFGDLLAKELGTWMNAR